MINPAEPAGSADPADSVDRADRAVPDGSSADLDAADPAAAAVAAVEDYLATIGRGDLAAAGRRLAPGAVLQFPGGITFAGLDELRASSPSRYRWVDKHRDRYESAVQADGSVLVVSLGRLFGENLHDVAFDGVRYVDIFTLRDGQIVEQLVFNDLKETGVLDAATAADLPAAYVPAPAAP